MNKKILIITLALGLLWGLIETFFGTFLHTAGVSGISKIMATIGIVILVSGAAVHFLSPIVITISCLIVRASTLVSSNVTAFEFCQVRDTLLSSCVVHILKDILIVGTVISSLSVIVYVLRGIFTERKRT